MTEETRIGPFLVERELGRGGMGVVYAALHEGRRVALKVSLDGVAERDRKHFLEEAELLARISHPAIVEILDSGTLDDGRPYLVMPLVEGRTLADRLVGGRLEADLALRLFAQLAGAVVQLHEAGIVHRDIKTENVMVIEDEERLVLLDFGIARDIDRPASTTTRMNLVRGTPGCMAPERFFGTRASASSDVYELGVVLYAMLVGQLPWDEPTDPEARLRPRHPAELGIKLPVGLGHILLEALSTRPDRRPSARELAMRVRAIELDPTSAPGPAAPLARTTLALPAPAPMESPPPRARTIPPSGREGRDGPAVGWIAGAVGLTALALGASIWARSQRPGAPLFARAGLGSHALTVRLHDVAAISVASADAAPAPGSTVLPLALMQPSTPAASPLPSPAPTAAVAVATTGPATAPAATVAKAAPGFPWCTRLADAYCTPAARKLPDGEARCAARRASTAKMVDLPATTQARGEAGCRDALPAVERSIRTPQASEAPEDLPWCQRVVGAYCTPEVRHSYGGDGLCSQAQTAWGSRLRSLPPDVRAAENEKCAQLLPAVVQAMKQHVRDLGPGTAASTRLGAAAAPPGSIAPATP